MAKDFGVRPSSLFAIQSSYDAYCLDQAVWEWGTFVHTELEKVQAKSEKSTEVKRQHLLLKLLSVADPEDQKPKLYADPASMFA